MPIHDRNLFSCFFHPLWGLLKKALKVTYLHWVLERAPEEVYQEADILLSDPEWADKEDVVGEDRNRLCREWRRRVYRLAKNLGMSPEVRFRRELTVSGMSAPPGEEGNVEVEDIIFSTHEFLSTSIHQEKSRWVDEHLAICRQAILATGNGQAETEWKCFKSYLFGKNLLELQKLTGWSPANSINDRLANCVERIREQAGVQKNLPLPPLPHFNAGASSARRNIAREYRRPRISVDTSFSIEQIMEKWGVSRKTAWLAKQRGWLCLSRGGGKPKKPAVATQSRWVKVDTSLSVKEIAEEYGVSKATAHRAKKRGWCCPGYHQRKPDIVRIMREIGCSRETAGRLAKKIFQPQLAGHGLRLANFTNHQKDVSAVFREKTGITIFPEPLFPEVLRKKSSLITEPEKIREIVETAVDGIAATGVDGIIIGGLTDAMIYAAVHAWRLGLHVFTTLPDSTERGLGINLQKVEPEKLAPLPEPASGNRVANFIPRWELYYGFVEKFHHFGWELNAIPFLLSDRASRGEIIQAIFNASAADFQAVLVGGFTPIALQVCYEAWKNGLTPVVGLTARGDKYTKGVRKVLPPKQ